MVPWGSDGHLAVTMLLVQCWISVGDVGPALSQQRGNALCLFNVFSHLSRKVQQHHRPVKLSCVAGSDLSVDCLSIVCIGIVVGGWVVAHLSLSFVEVQHNAAVVRLAKRYLKDV